MDLHCTFSSFLVLYSCSCDQKYKLEIRSMLHNVAKKMSVNGKLYWISLDNHS